MAKNTRFAKIAIDVGESTVKVIKVRADGKIVRLGTSDIKITDLSDETREEHLSATIREASRAARVRGGACVLVTGGPHVIVRRFLWPDMPADAIRENAESEIKPYLPGEQFQISCRVLGRKTAVSQETGNQVTKLDVLVVAMEKSTAGLLKSAARKAGFNVKRIDIRENAREKLTGNKQLWSSYRLRAGQLGAERHEYAFVQTDSFIILDLTDSLANMTVFINGMFYANRYFSAGINIPQLSGTNEAGETEYDFAYNLAAEVASVIDYVHYQERGSSIKCVLLFGGADAVAGFVESFTENLDIPVVSDSEAFKKVLLSKRLIRRGYLDAVSFLDAYGASHIERGKREEDIDLRDRKIKKQAPKWRLPVITGTVAVICVLVFAGIYFPWREIAHLESQSKQLEYELSQYQITDAELQKLRGEVEQATNTANELLSFHVTNSPMSEVLQSLYALLPNHSGIFDITLRDSAVEVRGTSRRLSIVADYIESLRACGIFEVDIVYTVQGGTGEFGIGFPVSPVGELSTSELYDFDIRLNVSGTPEGSE